MKITIISHRVVAELSEVPYGKHLTGFSIEYMLPKYQLFEEKRGDGFL